MNEHREFRLSFGLRCGALSALIFLLAASGPCAASDSLTGQFTPACAERDLRAIAAIEEFADVEQMPATWLTAAGFAHLRARVHCLAGEEAQGIALYDRIIAGDVELSPHLSASK